MEIIFIILGFIKNLFVTIYNKIGALGCVIILLVCLLAYERMVITHEKTKLSEMAEKVKVQNDAITDLGLKRDDLQKRLDLVTKRNDELTIKANILISQIEHLPVATTCDGAMGEVASSTKKNAELWNGNIND